MFGKLFATTFTGSMHGAGANVFAVWAYVIANTDINHHIELNPDVLAPLLGMSAEEIGAVIKRFCRPDAKSRNPEHDGRKLIEKGPYFYFVVNHEAYRNIRTEADRRKYLADKKRESRARQAQKAKGKGPMAGETAYVKAFGDGVVDNDEPADLVKGDDL